MPARPEIFISATTKDLKSCRQLVRDALLTLGCVPVVQDHFAPEAATVREMLRKRIAACDAVIHLAGECYGYEPQERAVGEARRSYTQMEYDIARELKKPLYTFVCAPDFPYDAHEPEDDELRALQNVHRAALTTGDRLYVPVKDSQELNLRVRELQTRVEVLSKDLEKTRGWLGRGIAAALAALALIGGMLWFQHRRVTQSEQKLAQSEQKVAQVSDELARYRQAVKALADNFGKDIEPGRTLTDDEKFERALAAVAAQQQVSVGELKTWMALFVAQVRANPGADFYDRALADFAEKHFAEAAANATKAAGQYREQRQAAEREAASASERANEARTKERLALTLAGDAEKAAGHYAATLEPYRQALALADKDREPLVWCDMAQNLEIGLVEMGRFAEAEPLARELMENRTALQGAENPARLNSINNLAVVLKYKGDLASAETLFRRCLEARERTLGKEHLDTLRSVLNLASVLYDKGDYTGAEALYRRCLEAQERTLGKEHPDTLQSVNNLAAVLKDKGDLASAETLFRRCLEARERTLGKEHPDTLESVNNLAIVLAAKGEYAGAEALFRRAIEVQERTLGKEHPDTLLIVNNLAAVLDLKGDLASAETLFRRCLEARERTLGKEHPVTAMTAFNLSLLEIAQGKLREALPLAEEAVAAAKASLPEDHPDRRDYEKNLADLRAKLAAASPHP